MMGHYEVLDATGTTTVIKCGDGEAKTPFVESRSVTICVSPDNAWTGSAEKWQGSSDGGTTWDDLMTASEIAAIEQGMVFKKQVTCRNQMRFSATATAGHIAAWLEADI